MATQKCLTNIASEKPPLNIPCTSSFCYKISTATGKHCSQNGFPMDTPILSFDPSLNKACFCCCSCFALNTPIEASSGQFVMIQDIEAGDTIMSTGLNLKWAENKVRFRTGDINVSVIPGLYYVQYLLEGENKSRHLLVTPDHLFLMKSTHTLKKVQHLIPGNQLIDKNGKAAVVQFVVVGEHNTSIQSIELSGKVDGKTLDGHLLNSNGVISADYAIQVLGETGNLGKNFLHPVCEANEEELDVGDDEYTKKFGNKEVDTFLDSEENWPKGFMPKRKSLVNIPMNARGYINAQQVDDVSQNAEFNALTNLMGRANVLKIFNMARSVSPNVTFILDWHNRTPNAYAFTQNQQQFIVVTGGLTRLKGLYIDGMAIIIGYLQAALKDDDCVGSIDYAVTENILRDLWPDSMLPSLIADGISQIELLFSFVNAEHSKGNPNAICEDPALDCRIQAYRAGFSFLGVPECALPAADYLELVKAYASIDNKQVTVVFDQTVGQVSGNMVDNYQFMPDATVTSATVNAAQPTTVTLEVDILTAASKYILTVGEVKSVSGANLLPGDDSVIVKTV